ncbi:MAG TPA: fatty acid desaturase [Myxococcales bacterium]|nr:fatty acid desaturase [Myxococcales bacterium]
MVYAFFVSHWLLSVLFQSLFQHRYAAHKMYSMGPRTERVVHFLTFLVQGSSYLDPRAYAILHREHHAFSDTERDPHTPWLHSNAFSMMWKTKERYSNYAHRRKEPEARFDGDFPEWPWLARFADAWPTRIAFGSLYTLFYLAFATHWWQLAFMLPFHFVLGPVHGAIVNWCGHKYGYQNFDNGDRSRNTLPFDLLTMGELFQNNHHKWGASPDFAARWFEVDPGWQALRLLALLRVVTIRTQQRAVFPEPLARAA